MSIQVAESERDATFRAAAKATLRSDPRLCVKHATSVYITLSLSPGMVESESLSGHGDPCVVLFVRTAQGLRRGAYALRVFR
jgi:hypothetical protein